MKLIWNSLGALLLFGACILLHVRIEEVSVDLGFSWTFSKMIPYVFEFILAVLLGVLTTQFLRGNLILHKFLLFASILIFSGIAFAIHPIYEGDFAHDAEELVTTSDDVKIGLTMVALPGCPYCLERIATLNTLHLHQPDLPITVVMLEGDTLAMRDYSVRLLHGIAIVPAQNSLVLGELVQGSYPGFFFKKEGGALVYRWNQVGFGTGALDWIGEQN